MIPYILAVVGGYLLGDSIGEDIEKKIPEFADGGKTEWDNPRNIKIGDTIKFSAVGPTGKVIDIVDSTPPFARRAKVKLDKKDSIYGKETFIYLPHIHYKVDDKFADGGVMADGGYVDSVIFDDLKKGDKINITFGSSINNNSKAELLVKSKNLVGKGKSYESEKITFVNTKNPNGVRFYAYKRKSGDVGFAIGDLAIHSVKIVGEKFADGGMINSLNGHYESYNKGILSGTNELVNIKDESDVVDYIDAKLGNGAVKSITQEYQGKTYPYNSSNPYFHDLYRVVLNDGTKLTFLRQYGTPNWSGNVNYVERIEVKIDGMMMANGGVMSDIKPGSILVYQTRNDKKFGIKGQYWKVISIEDGIAKIKMCDVKGNLINESQPYSNGQINLQEIADSYFENWKVKKLANGGVLEDVADIEIEIESMDSSTLVLEVEFDKYDNSEEKYFFEYSIDYRERSYSLDAIYDEKDNKLSKEREKEFENDKVLSDKLYYAIMDAFQDYADAKYESQSDYDQEEYADGGTIKSNSEDIKEGDLVMVNAEVARNEGNMFMTLKDVKGIVKQKSGSVYVVQKVDRKGNMITGNKGYIGTFGRGVTKI